MAAAFGEMPRLAAHVAGVAPVHPSLLCSFAAAGVILQFHFDLLAVEGGVVESALAGGYSSTALVASSPSLNSMKAKEYLLL